MTTTTPTITLEDVLRALMETRQMMEKKIELFEKRFHDIDRTIAQINEELTNKWLPSFESDHDTEYDLRKAIAIPLLSIMGDGGSQIIPGYDVVDESDNFLMYSSLLIIRNKKVVSVEHQKELTKEDVDEHLERLQKIKIHIPLYQNYTILGAVAAMVMPKEVSRYAHRKGLFVLAQSGNAIEIRNPRGFDAKKW